jgi:hypothetical protein
MQWEKKVVKAHGFDFFLEVEYKPLIPGIEFPCVIYDNYQLPTWFKWWSDFIEYKHVKVVSRLVLKEDMCLT